MLTEARAHTIRALVVAGVGMFVLCGGGIAATIAYFSSREQNTPHIKVGSVDIGFYYDGAYGKVILPDRGRLSNVTKAEGKLATPVDLSKSTDPVIDIKNAMPGLDATYMFHATNESNIDFSWDVGFVFDKARFGESPLLGALDITLAKGETVLASFKAESFLDPNFPMTYAMGEISVGDPAVEFSLNIALDYEEVGNEIVGSELDFDIYVDAKNIAV